MAFWVAERHHIVVGHSAVVSAERKGPQLGADFVGLCEVIVLPLQVPRQVAHVQTVLYHGQKAQGLQ